MELPESRPGGPRSIRRAANISDESTESRAYSLQQAILENERLEELLEDEASQTTTEVCLRRMLSINTVVSTTSSFAARHQAAIDTRQMFREISTGSTGIIFEHPGTVYAYKMPLLDNSNKLWNNYIMHLRVQSSFQSVPYIDGQVEIPRCFWYATPETAAFWGDNLDRIPDNPNFPQRPRHIFCMERIFPLPRPVRYALTDMYCPPQARDMMKTNEANKDCLVRPYLGRLKYGTGGQFFSLRNFKLHANQMKDIDLATTELCKSMAHALAVLHWHAKIDGMDVEFVLGSSPVEEQKIRSGITLAQAMALRPLTSTYETMTHTRSDFKRRITSLWMIDFDDCSEIILDQQGVGQAVTAFMTTNHYCPRPHTGDDFIESLWASFSALYVSYSERLIQTVIKKPWLSHLPRSFIDNIERAAARRQQA